MIEGIITKGIGGFYYVKTQNGIVESKARGLFREEEISPLIGDRVLIRISKDDNTGYIEKILDRESQLLRPPVANISQALIIMSMVDPDISQYLLDRLLIMVEYERLNIIIVLTKIDLSNKKDINMVIETYEKAGYKVLAIDNITGKGIEDLKVLLKNNISVLTGPSGVGKSTLLNNIDKNLSLKVGKVSKKTSRGKHTTRHTELLDLGYNTYVLDTPGFSSLNIDFIENEFELGKYFKEIDKFSFGCKFTGCLHDSEPNCYVKEHVNKGIISKRRYDNYLLFLEEIKNIRRY